MRLRTNQAGFSIVEVAIVAVLISGFAFIGYNVYLRQNTKPNDSSTSLSGTGKQSSKASDVASSPNIKYATDLDKAASTVDQTDPGGSNNADAAQLDSDLATF